MMQSIPFTQYLLPDGRKRPVEIEVADDVGEIARGLINQGLLFECEVLTTGHVSLTITDPEDGDLDIRVRDNGPGIREAVEEMVRGFDLEAARAALADEESA